MVSVLSIAGSDPSGGAGIQADLKTFAAHGVYGAAVITAVTVQNAKSVQSINEVAAKIIHEQIDAVFAGERIRAVKTGMLPSVTAINAVSEALYRYKGIPLVVDPVMRASAGQDLSGANALAVWRHAMLHDATLVTPNIHEASLLAGMEITSIDSMRAAARAIVHRSCRAVLVKGGHAEFAPATDVFFDGNEFIEFPGEYVAAYAVHGAGCTYASAITANLALGLPLPEAIARAKRYVQRAIAAAPDRGADRRPLNHGVAV